MHSKSSTPCHFNLKSKTTYKNVNHSHKIVYSNYSVWNLSSYLVYNRHPDAVSLYSNTSF